MDQEQAKRASTKREDFAGFGDVELPADVSQTLYNEVMDAVSLPFKIAVLLIIVGVVLMLAGIAGLVTFGFTGSGFSLTAEKASPGLVLALIGAIIVATYRPNIRIKK